MWCGGDDYNENGETVRLYHPILYGRKASQDDLTCSFVGGNVTADAHENPICTSCKEPLHLLVQLYVPTFQGDDKTEPVDRTLQVYACNHAACFNVLFSNGGTKLVEGGGVVVCRRVAMACSTIHTASMVPPNVHPSTWAQEKQPSSETDNEWLVNDESSPDENDKLLSLEAKLAAMESPNTKMSKPTVSTTIGRTYTAKQKEKQHDCNSFPCFLLHSINEPPAVRPPGLDDDDVGISGSDDKIQKMLARYMAEEEDEEILAALRVGVPTGGGGGGGGGGGEKDERLSAADRALLTFSDRMKRSPRQVLRYAYRGMPLWSIPVVGEEQQARHSKQHSRAKKPVSLQPTIPRCSCGATRVFEMQIVPTLLHVLEVDKAALGSGGDQGLGAAYEQGGMNWGNIGIFSCLNVCTVADQEYVIVQDSVDDQPTEPKYPLLQGDVVIQEDAEFIDEDDENDDVGDEDDEDEDGQW